MKHLTRRQFIKVIPVASATISPVAHAMAQELRKEPKDIERLLTGDFSRDLEFHVLAKNLLNLHFYFVNVKERDGIFSSRRVYPKDCSQKSFMIVRLPQQHVSEQSFFEIPPPKTTASARLSGFSFLAFELWPGLEGSTYQQDCEEVIEDSDREFDFSLKTFLDWNDRRLYRLITLVHWLKLREPRAPKGAEFAFVPKGEINRKNVGLLPDPPQATVFEPNSSIYRTYRQRVQHLLVTKNPSQRFLPITLFEVPERMLLAPLFRSELEGERAGQNWPTFLENRIPSKSTTKYEIWSNRLAIENNRSLQPDESEGESGFVIENPGFRAVGVISKKSLEFKTSVEGCREQCEADSGDIQDAGNILPTLLDKTELAYLTQFANNSAQADHRNQDFDIQEQKGFFFTGLGIVTHLKYYNVENKPVGLDLIEYEHVITQGRDVFIKVSRLGYNTKTGQKYKHVIEGKRRFTEHAEDSASFIELKQYCECIDKEFSYEEKAEDFWALDKYARISTSHVPITDLTEPAFYLEAGMPLYNEGSPERVVVCHQRRLPFLRIETIEKERIPIRVVYEGEVQDQNVCLLQCLPWFWPVRETTRHRAEEKIPLDDYLTCNFTAVDRDDRVVDCTTPFMFIRASLLEGATSTTVTGELAKAYTSYLFEGAGKNSKTLLDRRKIFLNRQRVGFTSSVTSNEGDVSKANIIETEFLDLYFRNRPPDMCGGIPCPAQKTPYILMPQLLRAQAYLDHVRDLTQQSIPSVMEYHKDYLRHNFVATVSGANAIYANGAKSILTNTRAFRENKEEIANRTFGEIKGALRSAKDKLGNLVSPDVIPETLSLEKFGITLPSDVEKARQRANIVLDAAGKITNISPYEILRGEMSEIMGGIDLREVLQLLLPETDVPVLKLSKALADISAEVTSSPVFQEIKQEIENVRTEIERYRKAYEDLAAKIRDVTETVIAKGKELSGKIPNSDELDHLLNNEWEKLKKQALDVVLDDKLFEVVENEIRTKRTELSQAVLREIAVVKFEVRARALEAQQAIADAKALVKELEATGEAGLILPRLFQLLDTEVGTVGEVTEYIVGRLKRELSPTSEAAQQQAEALIKERLDKLVQTVAERSPFLVGGSQAVYYDLTTLAFRSTNDRSTKEFKLLNAADLDAAGLLQLEREVSAFELFITKNINGNDFQRIVAKELQTKHLSRVRDAFEFRRTSVEALKNEMQARSRALETWLVETSRVYRQAAQQLSDKANKHVSDILASATKVKTFMDSLRKFDPYFYYEELSRIKKEIADIERRITTGVLEPYRNKLRNLQQTAFKSHQDAFNAYADLVSSTTSTADQIQAAIDDIKVTAEAASTQAKGVITEIYQSDPAVAALVREIGTLSSRLKAHQDQYKAALESYLKYVTQQATGASEALERHIARYIDNHRDEIEKVRQAQNLYRILTSIKQQDISYTWRTRAFRDLNLGFVGFRHFKEPATQLTVDVKATTYFAPGKFPPAIDRVTTYAENRLTNFGITFFDVITLWFLEASFVGGSETGTKFGVKIKDVQFGGSLSFIQKLEELLATAGIPLTLLIEPDHVALGYSLIIPSVVTPTFSFFDLSLSFDIRLYFDNRPLRFGFSLARRDRKFGIAAGIFAGFGYFGIVVEPKRGIVQIEIALEAGVWAGIRLGPISGEVKLAFGFYYRKNEFGVRLEGYIVAEGRLKVWVLEVSARIYLGIVSFNGVVEGSCTVTYTVKLGFISRSFSGTFRRKIAGAESRNDAATLNALAGRYLEHSKAFAGLNPIAVEVGDKSLLDRFVRSIRTCQLASQDNCEHDETNPVLLDRWTEFITVF